MIMSWYRAGSSALETGKFDPPTWPGVPRNAYILGWEDAINGTEPDKDEIVNTIMALRSRTFVP